MYKKETKEKERTEREAEKERHREREGEREGEREEERETQNDSFIISRKIFYLLLIVIQLMLKYLIVLVFIQRLTSGQGKWPLMLLNIMTR